jgi:outer membrane protein assembly factor BamA
VLDKILNMKTGRVADQSRLQVGLQHVRLAYAHLGYVQQSITFSPRLDDAARRALFVFEVEEGPQFRMGTLTFPGLPDGDAARLARRWRLKPGDIYDEAVQYEFFATELPRLRGPNGTAARGRIDYDRTAHLVNVRIVFE